MTPDPTPVNETPDEGPFDRDVSVWRGPGRSWGLVHTDRATEEEPEDE